MLPSLRDVAGPYRVLQLQLDARVVVHMTPHEMRVAARWDRIIGVFSVVTLVAIAAKLML